MRDSSIPVTPPLPFFDTPQNRQWVAESQQRAPAGDTLAIGRLSAAYLQGRIVPVDYCEAYRWDQKKRQSAMGSSPGSLRVRRVQVNPVQIGQPMSGSIWFYNSGAAMVQEKMALLGITYFISDDKGTYLFGGGNAWGKNRFEAGEGMQFDWETLRNASRKESFFVSFPGRYVIHIAVSGAGVIDDVFFGSIDVP